MSYFDPGSGRFVFVDGNMVERDALSIAERLADYDENLCIMCLDPSRAGINDAPFVICEEQPDGRLIRVFEAWQLDERILERIYNADTRRHNILAALEGKEMAIKKENESRYQEKKEMRQELMLAAIKNPTSTFTFKNEEGDLVKIHEHRPLEKNNAKKSFS